jgi:two-component system response regulator
MNKNIESHLVEILLIEDNPHEAELAIRNLKKHHLANNLIHIDDGAEALDFIFSRGKYTERTGKFRPKLILLDLKLPKVSGHEILKAIRESDELKSIPVVVLTSSNEESDIMESYKLGVNSYIVKPVNFEAFSKAIGELGMYWMVLNKKPASF